MFCRRIARWRYEGLACPALPYNFRCSDAVDADFWDVFDLLERKEVFPCKVSQRNDEFDVLVVNGFN